MHAQILYFWILIHALYRLYTDLDSVAYVPTYRGMHPLSRSAYRLHYDSWLARDDMTGQ